MTGRRAVCVVTTSRADFGLLREVCRLLESDGRADLLLLVTGSHLAPGHGNTVEEIERDGFAPASRVEMLLDSDTPLGAVQSLALATSGIAEAFDRLRPDLVLVLGDRYEILAAAQAALVLRIPVAHIHGGERSEGQIDESVRHAVTKLSHLHLVAAGPYRQRVIQMGEQPDRVHVVGAPGLDQIARQPLLDRAALGAALGLDIADPLLLVTYHPVTLRDAAGDPALDALTQALDDVPGATVIVTGPNADPGGHDHASRLLRWCLDRRDHVRYASSLGSLLYLSAMKQCAAVVGNTSSGIIEAPALGVPTVNIGPRQEGRLRAPSVIDCGETPAAVLTAVREALSPDFRERARLAVSPYGGPGASARIVELLLTTRLDGLLVKRFHDLVGRAEDRP